MTILQFIAVTMLVLPALAWTIVARQTLAYQRTGRPRGSLFKLMSVTTGLIALYLWIDATWVLIPSLTGGAAAIALGIARDVSGILCLAVGWHVLKLMPLPEAPPRPAWLLGVYGSTTLVLLVLVLAHMPWQILPVAWLAPFPRHEALGLAYAAMLAAGSTREAVRIARPGAWGPEAAAELRRPDTLLIGLGMVAAAVSALVGTWIGGGAFGAALGKGVFFSILVVPFGMRILGHFVPEYIVSLLLLGGTVIVIAAHRIAVVRLAPPLGVLVDFLAAGSLGVLLVPVQAELRAWVTALVLRRSAHEYVKLQAFLHGLSPKLGVRACCLQALTGIVRIRNIAGAAIILRDGEAIVAGSFDLQPLVRVWPRDVAIDALPARTFGTAELRTLPLAIREALVEANVSLGVAPITSARQRWGHVFLGTGWLGGAIREEDHDQFEAFSAQLALLLDAADLLERSIAVERSLAHAEKLAVIGETAARIAHEIRNPVTAARSLAQQLVRDPTGAHAVELGVILEALERVERQVASLLRFARKEELHLEDVDVSDLVRAHLDGMASRVAEAGIVMRLDVADAISLRADRDKLRQVVANLVDNAVDALADGRSCGTLSVGLRRTNAAAVLTVHDDGPGIPADAVGRVFEPFFSLKSQGTGLGLAIVKRTVDAHGGTITVASTPGAGTEFRVMLPLLGAKPV